MICLLWQPAHSGRSPPHRILRLRHATQACHGLNRRGVVGATIMGISGSDPISWATAAVAYQ